MEDCIFCKIAKGEISTERFIYENDNFSSRSSKALADLLIREQTLRGMIPETIPITRDPIDLTVREVYHLLESYLEMMDTAVQEKRGRAISEYTQLYETLETMNAYISRQIDKISLYGFREQLADYEQFITSSRELQMWNLLIIIFAFAWAISWIMHSISKITDPMHRLSQTAEELSKGNFAVEDIHVDAVAEVSSVVETFNRMKKDISQYIGEIQKQKTIEQEYLNEKLRNMKMEQQGFVRGSPQQVRSGCRVLECARGAELDPLRTELPEFTNST